MVKNKTRGCRGFISYFGVSLHWVRARTSGEHLVKMGAGGSRRLLNGGECEPAAKCTRVRLVVHVSGYGI